MEGKVFGGEGQTHKQFSGQRKEGTCEVPDHYEGTELLRHSRESSVAEHPAN